MEAQNVICFEFKKEDRIYRLQMPHGAPLGEAYEASASFLAEMVRMINEHAKDAAPVDAVVEPEVEVVDVESLEEA